ncbi:MAG: phosphomannomutase/phosphoglucomutase [Bdellovibrionales bacterium]|nr:phosphomannomutase/phosphoglucomutase [Bdellovibrionales bacterium]
MKINPDIFREYDIRGTVDTDLSTEFAKLLGRAYARLAIAEKCYRIGVGFDCRLTSEAYAHAFAEGLATEGLQALITGMGPTPQLYYSIHKYKLGGGVQITGSHNPPDMNGFKLCLGTDTLTPQQIQELRIKMLELRDTSGSTEIGEISSIDVRQEYIREIAVNCKPHMGSRKLKVVVDAGNGVGGLVGPQVLRELGVDVIELYCDPDGTFPNHHPDPTVLENIRELQQRVISEKADLGIGWDGDADRIGVVDEKGQVIFGDMLLLIYARDILSREKNAIIIGDVKCSALLFEDVEKRGGQALMWKTGHSLIKSKLKECNGAIGGEMSGHIAFKNRYYGFDDAIYSSSRLVEIVSQSEQPLSDYLKDLPQVVSTPEIRIDCPEDVKFLLATKAQDAFPEYKVDTTDGVRIQFESGWGLVRASNTQPVLVMRFEADNQANLDKYRKLVTSRLEEIKGSL